MEWSKIKNILIVALILTDILLVSLLIFSDHGKNDTDSSVSVEDALVVLSKNDITVSSKIPDVDPEMPVLTLTYDSDNGSFFYTSSEAGITLTENTALDLAESFISGLALPEAEKNTLEAVNVYPSEDDSGRYVVSYGSYYEDYKLENSYILCYVSSEGVTEMLKNHAVAEISGNSKQKIMPAASALLKYMNQLKSADPDSAKEITDVSLVYMVDSPYDGNITSDTAFPTWKITASDNSITYISAYN
ncbi:MAG: two-component system regulatory protein YycI [Firmicutes bacterium]|nr:hypothetical protein [Clostridiales bacterium]MBQ4339435.1 two-component system regulatory protein YycI [Bacillota bacterium]